jgi:putative ATPase subunit gpP of terminase
MAAQRFPDPLRNQYKILALQGIPLREIARRLGISHNTVLSWANRDKLHIRQLQTAHRKLAQEHVQQSTQSAIRISTDYVRENGLKSRAALSTSVLKAATHLESLPPPQILKRHQALEGVARAGDRLHGWSNQDQLRKGSVINIALIRTPPKVLASQAAAEGSNQTTT